MKLDKRYKKPIIASAVIAVMLLFWFSLSFPLFEVEYSAVIYSRDNQLLGAQVARDQQWRFPKGDSVPYRFKEAITLFEDEYFGSHPGVNPISLLRATIQNIRQKKVVSGGSTITMQVIRLAHQRDRTLWSKIKESILAIRLECSCSKEEILSLYAAHAPFGGNTVGIEAAAWRYFQRSAHNLSWAECAMLAVLPNAPGLVHTGKNRELLLQKRNTLLEKLLHRKKIDSTTYLLSIAEEIPQHPYPLPQFAPHLLAYTAKHRKPNENRATRTSIDKNLQLNTLQILHSHYKILRQNEIHNAAVIVVEAQTGKVRAYCANTTPEKGEKLHHNHVDIIQSRRSTGSILKPLLHTAALQDAIILPTEILADIPTFYKNFAPRNYNRSFDGAVPAHQALSRSLNVPAVRLLEEYDVARFCGLLQKASITSINKNPEHYGLSLILGGAEATLFEVVGVYAAMVRTLWGYTNSGTYYSGDFQRPLIFEDMDMSRGEVTNSYPVFSAGAIHSTIEALKGVERPLEETGWENFSSGTQQIAWKTGTSFGLRDAWAIGMTAQYVVGVWVGNATGEGRPGIIGGSTAGPIMFDVFRLLPNENQMEVPYWDLTRTIVCKDSGCLATDLCPADTILSPITHSNPRLCPYHKLVHLDKTQQFRVNSQCYNTTQMIHKSWFTLPPIMEMYYSPNHPSYQKMPPIHPQCREMAKQTIEFIYPQNTNQIYLPKDIDQKVQSVVIKVAHSQKNAKIFWHLNHEYLGTTQFDHQMEISPTVGKHTLTLVDEEGNTTTKIIECIGRGDN